MTSRVDFLARALLVRLFIAHRIPADRASTKTLNLPFGAFSSTLLGSEIVLTTKIPASCVPPPYYRVQGWSPCAPIKASPVLVAFRTPNEMQLRNDLRLLSRSGPTHGVQDRLASRRCVRPRGPSAVRGFPPNAAEGGGNCCWSEG
jgi:hypothetical protein